MAHRTDRLRWAALPYGAVRGESFAGADLTSVQVKNWFDRCDFSGADLRHATFAATFKMCSFVGANLRGAHLRGAHFVGCDLTDADLRDADLTGASFSYVNTGSDNGRTILNGIRWDGAQLGGTTFKRVVGQIPTSG